MLMNTMTAFMTRNAYFSVLTLSEWYSFLKTYKVVSINVFFQGVRHHITTKLYSYSRATLLISQCAAHECHNIRDI